MKRSHLILIPIAALVLLAGCDSSPKAATKSAPTTTLETGRFALQKILGAARLWAADAQPVRLESQAMKGSNGHDGRSGFWRASFASRQGLKAQPFTWSGMSGPDAPPRGIDHGASDTFNPANRSTQPFDLNYLRIDSDKAFDVAQEHGGKELLEKSPETEVKYLLDWDAHAGELKWHVIYGGNEGLARLSVVVDASTGQFVHKD
ncbi:MAG: hypothetical protein LAP21_23540 [Acidobacteriia bacterium]|nr:hypothetical protein [Terriglobia bacterium]